MDRSPTAYLVGKVETEIIIWVRDLFAFQAVTASLSQRLVLRRVPDPFEEEYQGMDGLERLQGTGVKGIYVVLQESASA